MLGFPDLVKARLDALHHCCRYYGMLPTCRMFQRLVGFVEEEDEGDGAPGLAMNAHLRLLYLQSIEWLDHSQMLVDRRLVASRDAVSCAKELVKAERFGPRIHVDVEEAIDSLAGDVEALLDVDAVMEEILYVIKGRNQGMARSIRILFEQVPQGTVVVSSTAKKRGLHAPGSQRLGPLQMLQGLLDSFLDRDPQRTGSLAVEDFSHVLLRFWIYSLEGHKNDGNEPLEISSDQFKVWGGRRELLGQVGHAWILAIVTWGINKRHQPLDSGLQVLQSLVYRFRDGVDGSMCYLDMWAMAYMETFREGVVLSFLQLADKAREHLVSMDNIQRQALLTYAGYYPLHETRNLESPSQLSLVAHSFIQQLTLVGQESSDFPGALTIAKPVRRFHRSCEPLVPPGGFSRSRGILHTEGSSMNARKSKHSTTPPCAHSRSGANQGDHKSSCGLTELSQWELTELFEGGVNDQHESNPMTCPWRERSETNSSGPHENLASSVITLEDSLIGRYSSTGRAASPLRRVYSAERGEIGRLIEEILKVLPPGISPNQALFKADKHSLERYLRVQQQRRRARGKWNGCVMADNTTYSHIGNAE